MAGSRALAVAGVVLSVISAATVAQRTPRYAPACALRDASCAAVSTGNACLRAPEPTTDARRWALRLFLAAWTTCYCCGAQPPM